MEHLFGSNPFCGARKAKPYGHADRLALGVGGGQGASKTLSAANLPLTVVHAQWHLPVQEFGTESRAIVTIYSETTPVK